MAKKEFLRTILTVLLILSIGASPSSNTPSRAPELDPVWDARITYVAERKTNRGVQRQTFEATYQIGWRGAAPNKEYTFFSGTVSFSDRGDFKDEKWDVGDTITFQTADEIGATALHGSKGEFETLLPPTKGTGEVQLPPNTKHLRKGGYFLGVGLPVIGLHTVGYRQFLTEASAIAIGLHAFYPNGIRRAPDPHYKTTREIVEDMKRRGYKIDESKEEREVAAEMERQLGPEGKALSEATEQRNVEQIKAGKADLWVEISATASDADEEMGEKRELGADIDEQQMEAQMKRWMNQLQRGREEGVRKEVEKFSADAVKQAGMKEFEGNVYSGSRTWKTQGGEITHTLSWSFALIPEDVEAVMIPAKNYEKWLPTGGKNEDDPGKDRLGIMVVLQKKGQPGKKPSQTAQFKFELLDVSHEKGVCLNRPPKDQAKATFDLKIVPGENKSLTIAPDRQTGDSRDGLQQAEVKITSYDWGAYGRLRVTAKLDNGRLLVAHREKRPGQSELTIPLDDNNNHIADAWEKTVFLMSTVEDSDEDLTPVGDYDKGDGLSLFEEYRGFMVKGVHKRTDPNKKTLFIHSDVPKSKPGIDMFRSASLMEVYEINKDEYTGTADRIINFNHGTAHVIDQHALWMKESRLSRGRAGQSPLGPPKNVDMVEIEKNYEIKFFAETKPFVIAHELGHAVRIDHHGDGNYYCDEKDDCKKKFGKRAGLYYIAVQQGENSGVQECNMRYGWADYILRGTKYGRYGDPEPKVKQFCMSDRGTGVNGPPSPKTGDAMIGRGACMSRSCVSDRYH